MTTEQLKLLVETVQKLSLARDITSIMSVVRSTARKLTGADGATFVVKEDECCYYADEDAIGPLWKGQKFPMSACISGWAMVYRQPAVVEDIYKDPRIPIDTYKVTFVKSLVVVPIRTMDPIGAIGNYWGSKHKPTDEEIQLLQSLADIVSVSIENVRVHNELEARVEKRTEQLNALNKELEAFSYSVSHDLRAPLRSINGFTEMLKDELGAGTSETAKGFMGHIENSATKMNRLIDELLAFSRLGQKPVTCETIDMNELTAEVLAELKHSMKHQADIKVGNLPAIQADYELMRQVMFNLIGNAIKYSSKNENPKVEITATHSGDEHTFIIKDNGVGFDMHYADRLFGTFQRLHTQKQFEGTGVGLALVQRIIHKHGGRIWADAKTNEGATFSFTVNHQTERLGLNSLLSKKLENGHLVEK